MSRILPLRLERVGYAAGGKTLVHDLDVMFEEGPRTVILGPNGAGKSLTLRLCHGLIQPTTGRIVWQGAASASAQRRQAMVFQRPVMLRRSVAANVDYALALAGVAAAERRARIADALEQTRLADLADRPARVLSIGEQQRLALARVWALQVEIVFLDEPTASLDPGATRAVEAIVNAMDAAGTKIVMTTHDLGQARRMADEILFLHQGRLIERAPVDEFFARPRTREAQAFVRGELLPI
ncbi:MAG: ATP-binding cassette domain-containing protein [Alphaproteobacteria bacterium]|nr:ATP-binding cassette domain-containing protein [Alphaproteobacteria bacterium]